MQSSFFATAELAQEGILLFAGEAEFSMNCEADTLEPSARGRIGKTLYEFDRPFVFFVLQSFLAEMTEQHRIAVVDLAAVGLFFLQGDFEKGGFAGPVAANDADAFSFLNV